MAFSLDCKTQKGISLSIILGLNVLHADSAACLVVDGQLKSAIAEERLGAREKHSPRFPANAIRRVMQESGVRLKDITHVAIGKNPNANYGAKIGYVLGRPLKSAGAVAEHFRRKGNTSESLASLTEICGADPTEARFEIVRVEHHLAHIASSYFLSPFESTTAGFSYDCSGDFVSAMAARCEGTHIKILDRVFLPHSLGSFYTALCQFIGFTQFGEEYKVMGLSAFGEDAYAGLMTELLSFDDSCWYALKKGYFGINEGVDGETHPVDESGKIRVGRIYTGMLFERLGAPRVNSDPISQREKNIARSCQARFEEAAMHCMKKLHALVPVSKLVLAGGCALNGLTNARIQRDTLFKQSYIQCAASDDGTCIGAAYYCYHEILNQTKRFHMDHAFWGPEYPDYEIKKAVESSGYPLKHYEEIELLRVVAKLIADGKVVGWYQGRSEWGPRALGNRSILANPTIPSMKDTINSKIKRRESFRPFAPSVLREHVTTYFEEDLASPFMMHVVKVKPEWRKRLPAVTHIDGTARLQTVERTQNRKYYDLIKAFYELSGVAIVLNTSFNENEPIVDTPAQAVACFVRTNMDVLCLNNYLVVKE